MPAFHKLSTNYKDLKGKKRNEGNSISQSSKNKETKTTSARRLYPFSTLKIDIFTKIYTNPVNFQALPCFTP